MIRCPECGSPLRVQKNRTCRYRESGLDSVVLTGIRVFSCPGCREEFPVIPSIVGLHREIAADLARKPSSLTGAEFRFLRKEMGLKAKDLARYLGTTDVTLSRWESGNIPINPAADRLLRVLWTLHAVQEGRPVEPAKFVQMFLATFDKIIPTKHPKALPVRIQVAPSAGRKQAAAAVR